ncbi:hypothetical protein [Frigoribacterium sp. MCBA15_019]|uniref:hypothetical protein n=1 Tax=Frigoribacterium sp. MCBA15_019 TaxID=1898745 RepID=UPI0008DCAC48|nr:hypothetical protein [Frigoribacterium sp. MCBA15_019]OII23786.1 hypothetical protein BIV04_06825 [Frigoribacterium sp. MCBA15_019]
MGRRRRRRQLVAGAVLFGLSLLAFGLGGPVSTLWPSAYLTVGFISFGLFLVALWLFLLVIAEREGPPPGAPTLPTRPSSPGWWPFQRRQPPRPREPPASSVDPWRHHTWEDRVVPVLRRVNADETLELLLVDDRGEGPIGTKREIVVAFSTQDLLLMSAALQADAEGSGDPYPAREIGFDAQDALAWSRRAARAARDAPTPRPGPPSTTAVGARRIAWTAWALEDDTDGDANRDPWFAVPLDQLEAVLNTLHEVAEGAIDVDLGATHRAGVHRPHGFGTVGVEDGHDELLAAGELVRRLRDVLRHAHEPDPASTFGPSDI